MLIGDPYSSQVRPAIWGRLGTVSAAHPLAVAAGQEMLAVGGTAADAAVAAQAVLAVVAPHACGLGGDMLALVHRKGEAPMALNGAGAAPLGLTGHVSDGAASLTVPGIVDAWDKLLSGWGTLPLSRVLAPAIQIARQGFRLGADLAAAVEAQRDRLVRGGAEAWPLLGLRASDLFVQEELADFLEAIARIGPDAFYRGDRARTIVEQVKWLGGSLSLDDLDRHRTGMLSPIVTRWRDISVMTQPPMSQGVLLNMALAGLEKLGPIPESLRDHAGIELTEGAFAYRARIAEGEALLGVALEVDLAQARHRGGPRAYLHTAGVAAADRSGLVISSLVSVFDDFGSCVFVPGCGITLNNRAAGFTEGPNAPAPGKRPVHTLAPALLAGEFGMVALATPGADGQVQTLLQVIDGIYGQARDLAGAIAQPRWRSENGDVLIETGHPSQAALTALGHRLRVLPNGDTRFGAVVCAGHVGGFPVAAADWRRETWCGGV
jgi:gamma-glutamyltranspeptidase/glutathione hydrolase